MTSIYEIRIDIDRKLMDRMLAPAFAKVLGVTVLAFGLLIWRYFDIAAEAEEGSLLKMSPLIFIITGILVLFAGFRAFKRQYKLYVSNFGDFMKLSFYMDRLLVEMEHDSAELGYQEIVRVKDTKSCIYLYPNRYRPLFLPKDRCDSHIQKEMLRLSEYIKAGKAAEFRLDIGMKAEP